jgi:MOSC domain-containing protein YiiM
MRARPEVEAVADHGFADDAHARPGGARQVLLMDSETLRALAVKPGAVKENITTLGLNLQALAAGMRLRIGKVTLEITKPCTPCDNMNRIRPGLRQELEGRRGMLARVLTGGKIRVGDPIEIIAAKF